MTEDTCTLTFMGTGTSQGVPIIGCNCPTCRSTDPRDKRFRSSALVRWQGMDILVDAGPDFRSQMLRAGVSHLDGILLTHNHRDHTGGLDDVRSLNYIDRQSIDIYCEKPVAEDLMTEYPYAFAAEKYPGAPEFNLHLIDENPFLVLPGGRDGELIWMENVGYAYRKPDGSVTPAGKTSVSRAQAPESGAAGAVVIPIRGMHGRMPVLGFRFGDTAYITDMSRIDDSELRKLTGLKYLTLNTVGYHPHHSHFSLDEALLLAGKIGAGTTYLTHLSHAFPSYDDFCMELETRCRDLGVSAKVLPAYDTLTLS